MADRKNKQKSGNAIIRYFRETRVELRKVRWPSRKEAWRLTKVVGLVTLGMAVLLGVMDLFFGWMLRGVISQNVLFMVLGAIVAAALTIATIMVGQVDEA
ncbi:MAG TPA: preprotein translocase subunit SecE [Thermoflexia bacterium]|nr:preprotein translocase subunit SecE [Thermoflexia bacterium]